MGRRGGDPNQHREKFVFNFSCPILKCKLYFIRDITGTCSSSEEGHVKLASLRKIMPEVHLYSLLKEREKLFKGQPGRTYSIKAKTSYGDFPDGPVAKTFLSQQCRDTGFDPGQGPRCHVSQLKNLLAAIKKKKLLPLKKKFLGKNCVEERKKGEGFWEDELYLRCMESEAPQSLAGS